MSNQLTGRIPTRGNVQNPQNIAIVKNASASSPVVGQLLLTGSVQQLPDGVLQNGIIATAKSTNSQPVVLGASNITSPVDGTGNGYILEAGSSISFALQNTSQLYVIGTAGDILSWGGS